MFDKFTDFDPNLGIKTTLHFLEDKTVYQKQYDAEPFLKAAAEERAATRGERWGEGRKVGTIPMAVISEFMRQDGTIRPERVIAWLKQNQAMVTFEKFLLK
jgi:hypothetical protein